jgi:hypothetical protein
MLLLLRIRKRTSGYPQRKSPLASDHGCGLAGGKAGEKYNRKKNDF